MKVIYNNKMVSEKEILCSANHRGLSYGDGLFETIICKEGVIYFLDRHVNRIQRGMEALGMVHNGAITEGKVTKMIQELILQNKLKTDLIRIKIIVWRKSGGLFTPLDNHIDYMVTVNEQLQNQALFAETGFSETIRLMHSPYSRFKTCNMLPYIMAGIEKQKRNLSELVLLSDNGHIAECSSSNIFWVKDDNVFTPSLETGCIEGIMRGVIIEKLAEQGKEVQLVKQLPEALRQADEVFTSNVSGIRSLPGFEKKIYNDNSVADLLSDKIFGT